MEHVAKRLHRGLKLFFRELRLVALHGGHESLDESGLVEIGSTDTKTAELLGECATCAITERIGRVRLNDGRIQFGRGRSFDRRGGGYLLRRIGGRCLGGGGGGQAESQGAGNQFTDHMVW